MSDGPHRLLARQLKKAGATQTSMPPSLPQWQDFLKTIHAAYVQSDKDLEMVERSLNLSSREMMDLYERLRLTSETQIAKEKDRLQGVIQSVGDGLCVLDASAHLLFANPAAEQLLGWPAQECLGIDILERIAPGHPYWTQMKTRYATLRISDAVFVRKDGQTLPVSFVLNPLGTPNGMEGAVLVFRDISDQKRTESALRLAIEVAESASRMKGEFLANMSHEIRTPMNGIIGFTEVLLNTPLLDEQRSHLNIVKASADALLVIINDILDFSKIEAGKMVLESVPFNLRKLVDETIQVLRLQAQRKSIGFEAHLDDSVPDELLADPGRVRQIITNLLSNAIKFTDQGHVNLSISSQSVTADKITLQVRIEDTGIGIPADKQSSIFEAFTQADGTISRRYGGTGLGLSISAHLVRLMGGEIGVSSRMGEGSTFTFTLPCGLIRNSYSIGEACALPLPSPTSAIPHRALRILLAEDNDVNAHLALTLLQRAGHTIRLARNGIEAVSAFRNETFDLILMDTQMPEMGGIEAAKQIRDSENASGRHIPIISLTANAMEGDRAKALASGMDGYLPKPIRGADLLRTVQEVYHTVSQQNCINEGQDN